MGKVLGLWTNKQFMSALAIGGITWFGGGILGGFVSPIFGSFGAGAVSGGVAFLAAGLTFLVVKGE